MSVQLVHCSDLHLDKNFNISNLARAQERKEDLNKNFSVAVEYALKNKPDLFLISGDVFDRNSPSNSARVFVTERVRQLREAGIRVFIIGGNHDVPKFGSQHLAIDVLASAGLATVFSKSDAIEKQTLDVSGRKVCVAGKSYFTRFESENPLRGYKIPIEGDHNILMIHGSLQGLNVVSSIPEMAFQNPFRPGDITSGLNYLALGHFHNHFEREHEGCKIVNPGSIERLSWGELNDEKGFVWAELNGSDASLEFIRLETRPMEEYTLDLSTNGDYQPNLKDYLIEYLHKQSDPVKLARLNLRGQITQEQYRQLKLNEIYEATRDNFFHLNVRHGELYVEGFGRVFMERVDNPIEAFTKRLDILISEASSEEKRRQLEQVKELGRKYLEEARA
ncbi:MAG: exonuclease SbcCD subunit D [Candidatus Bathyarchaeia archaeon]